MKTRKTGAPLLALPSTRELHLWGSDEAIRVGNIREVDTWRRDAWGRKRSAIPARPGSLNGSYEVQLYHAMNEARTEYTGEVRQEERIVPAEQRRCTATILNFEWRGNRCTRTAVKGTHVCPSHGGNLPSVKAAAQARIIAASDRAAAKLIYIALEKRGVEDKDRIRALVELLDRAGVAGKTHIEVEVKPWQQMLQRIAGRMESTSSGDGTVELIEGVDFVVNEERNWDEEDED